MDKNKLKRALAIVALVFMFIFTVSFVIFLAVPNILNGALGYLCLIAFLFGVGFFVIVKYILKDKEPPEYLPDELPDGDEEPNTESVDETAETEATESSETEATESADGNVGEDPQKSEQSDGD